jgi:hypothetical protein
MAQDLSTGDPQTQKHDRADATTWNHRRLQTFLRAEQTIDDSGPARILACELNFFEP